jgi:cobalt-zinc-cadmium efflux system outer membrane protein
MIAPSPVGHRLRRAALAAIACSIVSGCATSGRVPDRTDVDEAVRRRAGSGIRLEQGQPALPAGVSLDDGLTRDDAVAIALWNSPTFQTSLADLGLARADLVEARLLRNPVFSLLFPVGPKQLEWTLQFPVDTLWQRPRRIAAATSNLRSVAERLVSDALTLVANVRGAYLDAVAAERRTGLASENADLTRQIAAIADARLRAGDISELEARTARSEAAQVEAMLRALEHERDAARVGLVARLGVDAAPATLRLEPDVAQTVAACGPPETLATDALASRPDVRAAEMAIEAAGRRAAWERSRVLTLIAVLDANGRGSQPDEIGPGTNAEIPVFTRNQGGVSRTTAELERASQAYRAVRVQVTSEVRTAVIRLAQAQQAVEIWEREIVPSIQIEQRQAERAYQAGEVALLVLLDTSRRLVQARINQLEAAVSLERAVIALERSVGRRCQRS